MIKAAIAVTILSATMLVGSAQAASNWPFKCPLIGPCVPLTAQPAPVKQSAPKVQSVTPSIPIPPPVHSR